MARKRTTGDGEPYGYQDEVDLADYLMDDDEISGLDDEEPETGTIDVEAQIEWAGTIDQNGRDGVRRTRLDGIELDGIREAARELRAAQRTERYKSYQAKSWPAQLRQLQHTRRGRDLIRETGLSPRTIRRWQAGQQAPSRASREKLARAYEARSNPRPEAVRRATHGLAEAFTGAVKARYNVTVRLRDIRHLWVGR